MMRIAYLCGEYPRATDTFIRREVAELRSRGVHVETISVRRPSEGDQGTDEQYAERQRTHYLVPCTPWRLVADHVRLFVRSPGRYLSAVWMALSIRSPGIQALLYQMFYFAEAGLVAAHMARRHIAHLHNHAPDASGYVTMLAAQLGDFTYGMTIHGFGILSEPQRWRLREKLERAELVICISWHARSQAMLWTHRRHWIRFHVVHCGVTPDRYERRVHRGRGRRLLFVGRLDAVKGLPILIEAIDELRKTHPAVHLDIVGDGPERADLESLVKTQRLERHVTIHGYLSQRQIQSRTSDADIMVLSSFVEGVPVALMEGMAAGLPIVAPRIAGIPELVEDGVSGFLTPAADVNQFVERIDMLLNDPHLRNRMGAEGRRHVEREFNLDREVSRLAIILRAHHAGRIAPVRPPLDDIDDAGTSGHDRNTPGAFHARTDRVA